MNSAAASTVAANMTAVANTTAAKHDVGEETRRRRRHATSAAKVGGGSESRRNMEFFKSCSKLSYFTLFFNLSLIYMLWLRLTLSNFRILFC